MEDFYLEHTAELAVICTPPFLHREQSVTALRHGSYVLCEKPVAPTPKEAEEMLAAEREYGRFIAIGYQWSFSDPILELKKDILSGVLGAPLSMKTAICWPRNFAYYRRGSGWSGKIEKDGVTVLDSIASNACAHHLHNMLFLLGGSMDESAFAHNIEADCLRANRIETFDTCALRARASGVPIYFIASHATERKSDPQFEFVFENATVTFSEDTDSLIHASFRDGRKKCYGDPCATNSKKLWDTVAAIGENRTPVCTVKTAMAHTALIAQLHKTATYRTFNAEDILPTESGDGVYVKGLFHSIYRAYEDAVLLSELS
jgi:predicted dehydrogenase